ncbi:hypothetical protein M4V62_39580 [Streptomyces durmitorensis]|uniref:Uncharacterized protein n=1 Tax=Streptomyces durmitorensis TaxID=319947 RepID=A0ABY4Q3D0_9ACTN|nr:hypothetical protein [Streptomyces durmitorensis]UQT60690.1 hypothetical protein M4V62_39580 [Streptomyces durmitorensis]
MPESPESKEPEGNVPEISLRIRRLVLDRLPDGPSGQAELAKEIESQLARPLSAALPPGVAVPAIAHHIAATIQQRAPRKEAS